MRVLVLDVYPDRPYRVCKDNNGGFGTANDYGDGLVARLLTWMVARAVDFPPLHAVQTMGELRAAGHDVEYSRTFPAGRAKDFDLCLVVSSAVAHETELTAVRAARAAGLIVAAIGPFATVVPDPYVAAGAVVLAGEPEFFFHGLNCSAAEIGALGPVHDIEARVDLDDLSYPAWDLVFRTSAPKMGFLGGGASIPIASARGCPYSCAHYCTYPLQQGRKLRRRDPAKVAAEMAHWWHTLDVRTFLFRDPVFTASRRHVEALCDAIIATGLPVRFGAELHLKDLDEALVERLYRAGLRMVYAGIESVTPAVLADAARQTIPTDAQEATIRLLEKRGIKVKAMYIFGFPADTRESVEHLIDYAVALRSAYAQFCVFTPYPGTPIWGTMAGQVTTGRFEDFTQWHLVFNHPAFSAADIRELLGRAYRRYYTNPFWMVKLAKMVLSAS